MPQSFILNHSSPLLRVVHVLQLLVPGAELDDELVLLHHLPLLHKRLQDSAGLRGQMSYIYIHNVHTK